MPSSRGSSQPRDLTQVSSIAVGFFVIRATREAQEYWSGQPIPSPGDLPDPRIELGSPALQADSLQAELPGKPKLFLYKTFCKFHLFQNPPQLSFHIFYFWTCLILLSVSLCSYYLFASFCFRLYISMGQSYASLFHLGLNLINIPIKETSECCVQSVCMCVCDSYKLENIYISFQVCIQT